MCKKVLFCASLICFQGVVENQLEVGSMRHRDMERISSWVMRLMKSVARVWPVSRYNM